MRLVYENVEYLCKKNNIRVSDLLDLLGIDKEKFYSNKRSKTAERYKSEMFAKVADYFSISQEELENRFFEEPEMIWKLETDKEGVFRDLYYNSNDNYDKWKMLSYDSSKRLICDSMYKSFDFDNLYRFIAFRYDTNEFSLVLYNYAVHGISIDMCQKRVTNDNTIKETGLNVIMFIQNQIKRNIEPETYLNNIYNSLLSYYGINSMNDWHYNSEYKNHLFCSYVYTSEVNIISSDSLADVRVSNEPSSSKREERKRKIDCVIDRVIEIGRVPDEKIKELKYDLWHC